MESLKRQLGNKEKQFKEMSAQLVNHLTSITKFTHSLESVIKSNASLKDQIAEKDKHLENLLKEKAELFEILTALENPTEQEEALKNEKHNEVKQEIHVEKAPENIFEDEKKNEAEVVDLEEQKEEAYISDEIDITAELERLGLVDLIKKY